MNHDPDCDWHRRVRDEPREIGFTDSRPDPGIAGWSVNELDCKLNDARITGGRD